MIHFYVSQSFLLLCSAMATNDQYKYSTYVGQNLMVTSDKNISTCHQIKPNTVPHTNISKDFINNFPKCCPLRYKYEPSGRKCVESNETSIFTMLAIDVKKDLNKKSLSDCDVIVDHVLRLDDFKTLLGNTSIIEYKNESFTLGQYCIDAIENTETQKFLNQKRQPHKNQEFKYPQRVILRVCYESDYCTKKRGLRCLNKCCSDGEVYINNTCSLQLEYGFPIESYKKAVHSADDFAIFNKKGKCDMLKANLNNQKSIEVKNLNGLNRDFWMTFDYQKDMLCFEFGITKPDTSVKAYLLKCSESFVDYWQQIGFLIWIIVKIISCIFFIATMVIHIFMYKMEKVIHRIMFCYCLGQFIGFATLTYLQMNSYVDNNNNNNNCKTLGFVILFGFHAGFSWLSVICYDMWKTLRSMEVNVFDKKKADRKKTLYYCLYGWSVPTIITVFCYIEHVYKFLPSYLHPNIGDHYCVVENVEEGNYGQSLFFISPISIAALANILFFISTIRYIIKTMNDVKKMNYIMNEKLLCASIRKTVIAIKLFLMMGINWSSKIILSGIRENIPTGIKLFFDTINCCQGIFIFLIFMLNWKIIKNVVEKVKLMVVKFIVSMLSDPDSQAAVKDLFGVDP